MTPFRKYFFLLLTVLLAACGTSKTAQIVPPGDPKKEIADENVRKNFDRAFFEGQREKVLGNTEPALAAFQEAERIFPQSAAVHFEIASIFLQQGKLPLALEQINKAVELEDKNIYYYDLQARICHALQKHEMAAKAYEQVIRIQPGSVDAYFDAANEYIYAKDYNAALGIYNRMEDRFGISEDVIRQKEQLYLQLGKPEKAVLEVKKLIEQAPNETRYLGMLAELYWSMGKKEESVTTYRQILEMEPGNGFAHFGMAEYYRSENKRDEMLASLLEAFKDPRIDSKSKINVVISLISLIDRDPAIKAPVYRMAETIRDVHRNEAPPHAMLGDLYFADGQTEKALESYEQALNIDQGNFQLWQQYCGLLEQERDFIKLRTKSEMALERFPNQVILYYYNATANYRLKKYNEVIETGKTGLNLYAAEEEINAMLHTLMGDAYNELKLYRESDASYDKALEIEPDNAYVLNNYAYHLSIRKEDLEKAKLMSQKSLKLEPENPSYLDTYGWILYQNGEYAEAAKYVKKALEIDAGSPEVLEHMGDILFKLDQKADALEFWKKAFELNPDSPELKAKTQGIVNL